MGEDVIITTEKTPAGTAEDALEALPSTPENEDAGSLEEADSDQLKEGFEFKIYFIDVGQAESSLIICDGQTLLIDGGNVSDSSLIFSFLKSHGITHLNYIIGTHAHEDHIGGLAGALNFASVDIAYCPVTFYDTKAFSDFVKYLEKQNVTITVPRAGETFSLGSAAVEILGPVKEDPNHNNMSIVTKITYGNTSFIFTGDAEREEEADVLNQGYDLSASLLQVGHHGSDTSTTYPFLREIMPRFAIISSGQGNIYGHPHENLLSRLRDAGAEVYRTDLHGTIICTSDGRSLTFETEKTAPSTGQESHGEQSAAAGVGAYIGNKNSGKLHLPSCTSLPAERNRVYFDTREEAIDVGFEPCKNCRP